MSPVVISPLIKDQAVLGENPKNLEASKKKISKNQLKESLFLEKCAKYLWWKTPQEALLYPDRILAQVMNLGDYGDVCEMLAIVNHNRLKTILKEAELGLFNARSWHYWHYKLGLAHPGEAHKIPPLPQRNQRSMERKRTNPIR